MSIKKVGNKFIVTNKDGTKVLGTHTNRRDAMKQLIAIEINKKRESGKEK